MCVCVCCVQGCVCHYLCGLSAVCALCSILIFFVCNTNKKVLDQNRNRHRNCIRIRCFIFPALDHGRFVFITPLSLSFLSPSPPLAPHPHHHPLPPPHTHTHTHTRFLWARRASTSQPADWPEPRAPFWSKSNTPVEGQNVFSCTIAGKVQFLILFIEFLSKTQFFSRALFNEIRTTTVSG